MPVQMNRVRSEAARGRIIVNHNPNAGVRAEVLDVPFRFKGIVSSFGQEEDRVVVVCAEGRVVHVPEREARGVGVEVDVYLVGCWGRGVGLDGEPRDRLGEGVVGAD